jgi:hypothetical protein
MQYAFAAFFDMRTDAQSALTQDAGRSCLA